MTRSGASLGAVGVLVIVATMGGCSSSRSANSPTTSGQRTITTTAPAAKAPDLQAQLLTLADMPTGWKVDNTPDSATSGGGCLNAVTKLLKSGVASHAEADYAGGTNEIPSMSETMGWLGTNSQGAASTKFAAASAAMDQCKTFTIDNNGTMIKGTVGRMNAPGVGDQSGSWQVEASAEGFTLGLDFELFRKGDELATVVYDDLGTPDLTQFTAFCTQAAARMS